jgi:hypothetical protein
MPGVAERVNWRILVKVNLVSRAKVLPKSGD